MKVSRWDVLCRGVRNRCPNCRRSSLFRRGFEVHHNCPACDFSFERGEGFFLESMSINYVVTVFVFLAPILVLYLTGILSGLVASVAAGVGAVVFPVLFYRSSRSWWLMAYFLFLPHHLPANARERSGGEAENA